MSFKRLAAFDLLRWISHRYGFGTYLHFLEGYLSRQTAEEARDTLTRLVKIAGVSESNVFVDTVISPSYTTAICQAAQLPGVSGKENNMILFEFSKKDPAELEDIIDNYQLLVASGFDVAILGSCDRDFGYRKEIHIWITPGDFDNASLMILLAYIILGHRDWNGGVIKLFALFPEEELDAQRERLLELVHSGRLPLSAQNIHLIGQASGANRRDVINRRSRDADLTILGFVGGMLKHRGTDLFSGYDEVGNVLFVNTTQEIELIDERNGEDVDEASPELLPEKPVETSSEPEADG